MELRFIAESVWGLLSWRHQNHDCTGLQNAKGRSVNSQRKFILPFPSVPLFPVLRLETGEGRLIRSLGGCITARREGG